MNMLWFTIFLLCLNIVTTSEDATLGIDKLNPGSSCNDIYQRNPFSRGRTGYYWIATNEGLFSVTCNMKLQCGGVKGGWMQVIDVDMDRASSCSTGWYKVTSLRKLCLGYTYSWTCSHSFLCEGN